MRAAVIALVVVLPALSQPPRPVPARYGLDHDSDAFLQSTPKETLASVIKAINDNRIDYLLAHLVDPDYVIKKLNEAGDKFDRIVEVTRLKLADDPESVKELKRFAADGEWEESGDTATVKLKSVPTRQVYLKRIGDRWFFENRQKAK